MLIILIVALAGFRLQFNEVAWLMQILSRLLRSKNPDDLQAANRLIKNIVKQVITYFSWAVYGV
jgi:hypothetical protein